MAGSLKDQLVKAGLVSKQQAKKAEHQKRKSKRAHRGSVPANADSMRRVQAEKVERDRELNRKRQQEAEGKANAAAIRQMIETNRVEKGEGDIPYNFTNGSKISRIYVSAEIRDQLVKGTLCIAKLDGRHELVCREVAEKIQARDPRRVIMPEAQEPETRASDDPYADYQVPDDLIW